MPVESSCGRTFTHQCYQSIGECAAPTEVVVSPLKLLKVHLVALCAQHVTQRAGAEQDGVSPSRSVEFRASGVQVKAQRLPGAGDELARHPIGLRVGMRRIAARWRSQMESAGLRKDVSKCLRAPQTGAGSGESAGARSGHNRLARIAGEVVEAMRPGQEFRNQSPEELRIAE